MAAESSCEATERQRNASRPADLFWAGHLLPHDTISRVHLLVQRRANAHVGALGAVALAFNAGAQLAHESEWLHACRIGAKQHAASSKITVTCLALTAENSVTLPDNCQEHFGTMVPGALQCCTVVALSHAETSRRQCRSRRNPALHLLKILAPSPFVAQRLNTSLHRA